MKEAISSYFVEPLVHSSLSEEIQQKSNAWSINKSSQWDSPKGVVSCALRKEQCAATSAELLVHSSILAEGQETCNALVNCPRYW